MTWLAKAVLCIVLIYFNCDVEAKKRRLNNDQPAISPRITGGDSISIEDAPYQCSLQKVSIHICGCAIIKPDWIITAAHCVFEDGMQFAPDHIEVVVGTNKWETGGVHYKPSKIIPHKEYKQTLYPFDIALIKLKTPIKFNKKVQPINYSNKEVPSGKNMRVSGWGLLWENGDWPEDLQALNITSITDSECKKTFEGDVHESHLCAICSVGHGICNRDSGGPLAYNNELVGVVNWSEGCGTGKPEGFAKISYFYPWIEKKIKTE